jgi:hypothetical protein
MAAPSLSWFAATDLSLAEFKVESFADAGRFQALRRLQRAADGDEQTCVVCSGTIRAVEELGGVVVASCREGNGRVSLSTSQPVCDGCAADPERALEFAHPGIDEAMANVRLLTGQL